MRDNKLTGSIPPSGYQFDKRVPAWAFMDDIDTSPTY